MKLPNLFAGVALVAASMASVAYTPGGGIAGTPHDWSGVNATKLLQWVDGKGNVTTYDKGTPYVDPATGKQGVTTVTIGQCTRCHTPHQAKSVNLGWNHTLQAISYRWDSHLTTAGTPYATFQGDSYKGPSTKCLSCHDGLLASTHGMWFNRAATSGIKYVSLSGTLNDGYAVADGPNLSKTHPVAMPYPLNGTPNTYNFVRNGAQTDGSEWVANPMATKTSGSTTTTVRATSFPGPSRAGRASNARRATMCTMVQPSRNPCFCWASLRVTTAGPVATSARNATSSSVVTDFATASGPSPVSGCTCEQLLRLQWSARRFACSMTSSTVAPKRNRNRTRPATIRHRGRHPQGGRRLCRNAPSQRDATKSDLWSNIDRLR